MIARMILGAVVEHAKEALDVTNWIVRAKAAELSLRLHREMNALLIDENDQLVTRVDELEEQLAEARDELALRAANGGRVVYA